MTAARDDRYPSLWIRTGDSEGSDRGPFDPPPALREVQIERTDHAAVPVATFRTLAAAEDAIRVALAAHPLVDGAAPIRIVVRLAWVDNAEQRATVAVDAHAFENRRAFGVIKWHLLDLGRLLLRDGSAAIRAWGAEVRQRLANDRSDAATDAADAAWRDSLRFLPTADGAAPPPVSEVIAAFGSTHRPILEGPGGIRYASVAAADAAIAEFMRGARARRDRDAVVTARVTWADGMAFEFWCDGTDPDLASAPSVVARAIAERAARWLSTDHADRNRRATTRRPLEPQHAWARELLRRIDQSPPPVDAPRNARHASSGPPPAIRSVAFTSCDVAPVRKALVGHEFRSLAAADVALARALSEYPADADGRVGFLVTWTDGATHEGIAAFTRADADGANVGHTAVLRRHLRAYALTTAQAAKLGALLGASGAANDARQAWGVELARRLDADDANRGGLRNDDSATTAASVPAIREVAILWAENDALPLRAFPSLWEADAAVTQALQRADFDGASIKAGFVVSWTDGASYEGRLDVDAAALARAPSKGGLVRAYLDATARWLQGDEFRRIFGPHFPPERIARDQAWGRELARRLDADRLHHDDPAAPRNRASAGAP